MLRTSSKTHEKKKDKLPISGTKEEMSLQTPQNNSRYVSLTVPQTHKLPKLTQYEIQNVSSHK